MSARDWPRWRIADTLDAQAYAFEFVYRDQRRWERPGATATAARIAERWAERHPARVGMRDAFLLEPE